MWKKTTVQRDEKGIVRFNCEYKTIKDRLAIGRRLREEIPRNAHTGWTPSVDRRSVVSILEESNAGRLEHLIPIRYARMLKSPFAFYRGAAAIMSYDLSGSPQSEIIVQACGDCHLLNFGLFATPERNLIFDLNDFDETHPAPFEWDLKRLATSFYIACQSNRLNERECKQVVRTVVASYREAINRFSTMRLLDIWHLKLRMEDIIAASKTDEIRKNREKIAEKARKRVADYVFPKISESVDGRWRIVDQPPLIYHSPPDEKMEEGLLVLFDQYVRTLSQDRRFLMERYRIEDMVMRVVGVGSVGTRCGIILLIGENEGPLLIQIKEARPSVLQPYTAYNEYEHNGERVVQGQRLMQSASDALLGWTTDHLGIHYYLRQYRDMKYSINVESLPYEGMISYAEGCGWTLARAHARSGDATVIAGYIGKGNTLDRAITSFAKAYAAQNKYDYLELMQAAKDGIIRTCDETGSGECPSPDS